MKGISTPRGNKIGYIDIDDEKKKKESSGRNLSCNHINIPSIASSRLINPRVEIGLRNLDHRVIYLINSVTMHILIRMFIFKFLTNSIFTCFNFTPLFGQEIIYTDENIFIWNIVYIVYFNVFFLYRFLKFERFSKCSKKI